MPIDLSLISVDAVLPGDELVVEDVEKLAQALPGQGRV